MNEQKDTELNMEISHGEDNTDNTDNDRCGN